MIETKESREAFEKRRETTKAALRHALRGELPMEVETDSGEAPVKLETKVPESNKTRFDKVAYQREYMRKRRANALKP